MRIEDVLREREHDEVGISHRIEDKLELIAWPASGRQAKQNIWIEDLVTRDEWNTFINAIRDCANEPAAIRATVSRIMSDFKLKGRRASCATTTIFGRAVLEEDLVNAIHGDNAAATKELTKAIVRHAKSLHDLDDLLDYLADCVLGAYVMWATFNDKGRAPFADLPESADGIRAALGLSKRHGRSQPLLLLQYTLEDGEALMPRVTEAYAGPMWTHYFRPAGRLEQQRGYGRTFPWDEVAEENGTGEPEVVHKPIYGNRLAAAIVEKS
jgi:hypothetical protein